MDNFTSNTIFINPITISSGLGYDYTYTTNTTSTSTTGILSLPNYKKCRSCNHAHLVENQGCIEVTGLSNSVYFAVCSCKEYVPQDNLEFLEYLSKKKESL